MRVVWSDINAGKVAARANIGLAKCSQIRINTMVPPGASLDRFQVDDR